mgnify:CR=1 FL=1
MAFGSQPEKVDPRRFREQYGVRNPYLLYVGRLEAGKGIPMLPGHGPEGEDLSAYARKYIDRRNQRLDQIREALKTYGDNVDINTLVDAIYDDVDPVLRGAAEQSTRVALRYLQAAP